MTLKKQFESVFSWGNRIESGVIRFQFSSPWSDRPKVAFVAPKRYGNAVQRNKAKRRLREIYRLSGCDTTIQSDVVIIAKRALTDVSFRAAQDQFGQLLKRISKS